MRVIAGLLALAVLASACTSDGGDGDEASPEGSAPATSWLTGSQRASSGAYNANALAAWSR